VSPSRPGQRSLFLSWIEGHGRSEALAAELGAEAVFVAVGRTGNRWTAPFRHAIQAVLTVVVLLHRRPQKVYVMAPPALPVAIAEVYASLTGASVCIDAHTGALLDARTGAPTRPMRRLLRAARLTLVTSDALATMVRGAGGRALVVHNRPPLDAPSAAPASEVGVLLPCGWAPDEPMPAVLGAAALLPDVRFTITGRPRPALLGGEPPANVHLTGRLSPAELAAAMAGADVVLALTTRPLTMQQGAYEAMAHARPLVVSDSAVGGGII
jgi:hypothetical protein